MPAARTQAPRRRVSPPPRRGGGGSLAPLLLVAAVVVAAAFLLQYKLMPNGFGLKVKQADVQTVAEIHASKTVRLSEIMSSNGSALLNEEGDSCDWVEIENVGSSEVNLSGWSLAKVANSVNTFTFPEHMLAPGERILIYADGRLRNTYGYQYHLPFRISASGDTLMLFNAAGTAVDTANVPELRRNEVYRRMGDAWEVSPEYTPGMENTHENYQTLLSVSVAAEVRVNELMAVNASYLKTDLGVFDYIELVNPSAEDADLTGWYLSDSRDNPAKWRFPDGTVVPAGGYLLIYASGLDEGLHTNFKLASEGEDVVLANENGQPVDIVSYDILRSDQAYSRQPDGSFSTSLAPTPGMANTTESAALIESQFAARNTMGVFVTEVVASTSEQSYDWAEIYNASAVSVDLSGYGLSDDAARPRRWQFPAGTVLAPGQYLGVFFSGLTGKSPSGAIHADFRLAVEGGYGVTLATPAGEIFDRVPMPEQFTDVSYGRVSGQSGFRYLGSPSPGGANGGEVYDGKTRMPEASVPGGVKAEPVTVELTVPEGARVYYTLDSTAPDESDARYTGPIRISATAVLRARAFRDGMLPSYIETETYLFGVSHDLRVVSLVCEPYDLFDETNGLYMRGPNASSTFPYTGANFWRTDEIEGHIEMYALDGSQMFSQGCGVRLHGQYSRAEKQKAFKIIARSEYAGMNRFHARIFENRPYEEYQSFLLRGSGQDGDKTRMRDSVLQRLAANTSVMYQETELAVVYINGRYWGHYNIRERINKHSICQFENWEGDEDKIDLIKANSREMQGSNDTYAEMLTWVKKNGIPNDQALEAVGEVIDLQNYIEYHAIEIFVGNGDTLNVKRYRNGSADGKWRYCLFDLDWAFFVDTNSIGRWLEPGGMGTNKYTDNALFIALMKNATFRDRFLTYMGHMMATDWTTEHLLQMFTERYEALQSEMPRHMETFGFSASTYASELKRLNSYCKTRPGKLLGYFKDSMNLSDADMEKYFGDAMRVVRASQV